MDFKTVMENMKKENGAVPRPMELLGQLDESLVMNHVSDKQFVYSKTALPTKFKALLAVAVGIALDAPTCVLSNVQAAKKAGASNEEIMETFAVAKFSKGASAISSSMPALEWLVANK